MEHSTFRKLRSYNLVMAGINLAQAVLVLLLSNDLSLPVTTSFLNYFPDLDRLLPVSETLGTVRVGYLLAAFFLASATAHLIVWLPRVSAWYGRNLDRGINYVRWYEYAVSASIMIVVIALLAGVYDVISLLLLFVMTALMNLFGLLMEQHNQAGKEVSWTSFVFGSIAGLVPWIAIGVYFLGSAASGEMPVYVYFVMVSIFVLFFCFALNMYLQYRAAGPWRDYLFGERIYILLSLIAKSALAWQVFFGALARGDY